MIHSQCRNALFLFLIAAACVCSAQALLPPFNHYLTYAGDPSTSIVVNFHTRGDSETTIVYYDEVSRGGDPSAYAHKAEGQYTQIPELPQKRTLHWAELKDLKPGTTYYYVASSAEDGDSEERSFRTIPDTDAPLRFATGGDMGPTPLARQLLEQTAKHDPMFTVIGGDIVYANGKLSAYRSWDKWFDNYDETMRTSDGRMIPLVVAIGNHETNDLPTTQPNIFAPFYTYYFANQQANGRMYFDLQFGKNFALIALDSGHVVPHAGEQTTWLAQALSKYQELPYRFCVYHVPLYPSHRDYEGTGSQAGRLYWMPYFDAFNVTTCFENHDHTLKRSKLLKNGQEDPTGTLYIGDGSYGVGARTVDDVLRPYLEVQQPKSHFWIVDVATDKIQYQAYDENGAVLDQYEHTPQ
jgi:hypothetical protein